MNTEKTLRGLSITFAEIAFLAMGGSLFGTGIVMAFKTEHAAHLAMAVLGASIIFGAAVHYRQRVMKILDELSDEERNDDC
jgi:hypothetical protein